jgi:hypothetical protein
LAAQQINLVAQLLGDFQGDWLAYRTGCASNQGKAMILILIVIVISHVIPHIDAKLINCTILTGVLMGVR